MISAILAIGALGFMLFALLSLLLAIVASDDKNGAPTFFSGCFGIFSALMSLALFITLAWLNK